jgi:hypothetical protein
VPSPERGGGSEAGSAAVTAGTGVVGEGEVPFSFTLSLRDQDGPEEGGGIETGAAGAAAGAVDVGEGVVPGDGPGEEGGSETGTGGVPGGEGGGDEGVVPGEVEPQAEITAPPRRRKRHFTMGSTQEMEED